MRDEWLSAGAPFSSPRRFKGLTQPLFVVNRPITVSQGCLYLLQRRPQVPPPADQPQVLEAGFFSNIVVIFLDTYSEVHGTPPPPMESGNPWGVRVRGVGCRLNPLGCWKQVFFKFFGGNRCYFIGQLFLAARLSP